MEADGNYLTYLIASGNNIRKISVSTSTPTNKGIPSIRVLSLLRRTTDITTEYINETQTMYSELLTMHIYDGIFGGKGKDFLKLLKIHIRTTLRLLIPSKQ